MKNKKNFLVYIVLSVAVILLSVTSTLALILDSESKTGSILEFGKVSLCANGNKSVLGIEFEDVVSNGVDVLEENAFKVYPTQDTQDLFLRLRVYYTLGSEELDSIEENKKVLDYLNNGVIETENGQEKSAVPKGFELYNKEGNDYGYTIYEGWAYLVTLTNGEDELLKVVTKEDFNKENGFIISESYKVDYDEMYSSEIVDLNQEYNLFLKVEVQAMQAYGLDVYKTNEENSILSSNSEKKEEIYGNIEIPQYLDALYYNRLAIDKPTLLTSVAGGERNGIVYQDGPFINSTDTSRGGKSFLKKYLIRSVKLTDVKPDVTNKVLNTDYYLVDSGTVEGYIYSYWFKNGSYYDVIVYQRDGVKLNPNSSHLFSGIGALVSTFTSFDMSNWVYDSSEVTNMYMIFDTLGRNYLTTFKTGDNFDTSNVEDFSYMFASMGARKKHTFVLGKKFDTSKAKKMDYMFGWWETTTITTLDLSKVNFNIKNVKSSTEMFTTNYLSKILVNNNETAQWLRNVSRKTVQVV